jgi:hypothetical protein
VDPTLYAGLEACAELVHSALISGFASGDEENTL